jgi:Metallo-beta-lactamase superfamily
VGLQINTIVVDTGDKLVLIDAGCGVDKFQKTAGGLLGNLAAAGYAPGDIDMILFTHCHVDHLWGISDGKNASLLFPSAEFVASETEVAFWSAPDLPGKVSPKQQPLVTQANLKLASPRLHLIKAGAEVAPGVTTFDTAGHTPGHISVHISSGSEEMLGGQFPASGMAVRVRPGCATGNKGAHGFPRPRSGRQDAGRQLPSTFSWLRARSARGERLPLAARGLAVDDLTTTPGGGGVPLKLQGWG